MPIIRQVLAGSEHVQAGLSHLLTDAVHGGASLGFLAPLATETADRYWQEVFSSLGSGLCLWVAEIENEVVGSVQLVPCQKQNGLHRAEIQKLFVLSAFRGQGISSKLMETAERHAVALGRTLLVLDTEAGSFAESVYRHLGWQKAGEIPLYAKSPHGQLNGTAIYFKQIGPQGEVMD